MVNHRDHAHLYLSALNHGAVKSLSCSLSITTICECYKTESLHARQTKHALKTASLKNNVQQKLTCMHRILYRRGFMYLKIALWAYDTFYKHLRSKHIKQMINKVLAFPTAHLHQPTWLRVYWVCLIDACVLHMTRNVINNEWIQQPDQRDNLTMGATLILLDSSRLWRRTEAGRKCS